MCFRLKLIKAQGSLSLFEEATLLHSPPIRASFDELAFHLARILDQPLFFLYTSSGQYLMTYAFSLAYISPFKASSNVSRSIKLRTAASTCGCGSCRCGGYVHARLDAPCFFPFDLLFANEFLSTTLIILLHGSVENRSFIVQSSTLLVFVASELFFQQDERKH